ncbi:unnamed protein product [Nezara viridula]|uniref:CRAL-TRIO domain-containing protein n=1 Tax=Nezara viridula TaxID=85310 RepID=A0A9P0HD33_NEZVI|nr:unnamed protein product [Nezara viridula]
MENGTKTNQDPKIKEDIEILRTWLRKQPHMPQDIDDELLMPFICGTKSIEKAKRKLESFCTLHSKYTDNFSFPFRDPLDPVFQASYEMGKMFMLPKTTPEGYRVFFAICDDFDKYDGFQSNVIMSMVLEVEMMMHPDSPGIILAFDCRGVDVRIMTKMGLSPMTFFLEYLQNSIPMKMKRMLIYNTPPIFGAFVNTFVKPYAKKKLFDRIIFTTKGDEALKEYFPVDILPCDIDPCGKAPPTRAIEGNILPKYIKQYNL